MATEHLFMPEAQTTRTPPRASVPTPSAIGRYRVTRLLGEGAMGRVYHAIDSELERPVAIKVLRLDTAGNARDAYIARFKNEARAAARFMHPNVVAVYDAGVDKDLGPYLVYEFIPGRTLRARIAEGRLDATALVALARGIGSALDALHAAEIIHRDIKPDNILLAPTGSIKLTDFGIARVPDAALTREGQFLGTPAYAAPEAITRGEYSARGDVFSFAAVLYESLCGTRPFPGEDAVAVSYAVAHDTPPPPSKYVPLPAAVDAAFEKGLAKRTADRYASAGELAGALYNAFRAAGAEASASSTLGSVIVNASSTATAGSASRRPQHREPRKAPPAPPPVRAVVPAILAAIVLAALAFVLAKRFTSTSTEHDAPAVSTAPHAAPRPSVATPPTSRAPVVAPTRPRPRATNPIHTPRTP